MQPKVNIALRAARRGSRILANFVEELDYVSKGQISADDFIKNACENVEKEIFIDIKTAFEDHSFEAEHTNLGSKKKDTPHKWLISAIDSPTNFIKGVPHFTISIVHTYEDVVEHAVIVNPLSGLEFTASKGHGAYQNSKRIRASERKDLDNALVALYCEKEVANVLSALAPLNIKPVIDYSPVLNAAYVAAGKYDAALLKNISPYNKRPIVLLLQEAGCLVCDLNGSATLSSNDLVAAPSKLLKPILKALN